MLAAADQSMNETATQEDLARLIKSIQVRDEKLMLVETELRRITDDYRRLREEILPVIKIVKDRSHPLPPPSSHGQSSESWHDNTATLTPNTQPQPTLTQELLRRRKSRELSPSASIPTVPIPKTIHQPTLHLRAMVGPLITPPSIRQPLLWPPQPI